MCGVLVPYIEMERQSHELRKRLVEALGDANTIGKGVNVYYDDPRFSPKGTCSSRG